MDQGQNWSVLNDMARGGETSRMMHAQQEMLHTIELLFRCGYVLFMYLATMKCAH